MAYQDLREPNDFEGVSPDLLRSYTAYKIWSKLGLFFQMVQLIPFK